MDIFVRIVFLSFAEGETELIIRDLSDKGLQNIEFISGVNLQCLIYDRNNIRQLENLHHYESLTKVSDHAPS